MPRKRQPASGPERDRPGRPPGKTGSGDAFRDSERAGHAQEGGEEWHERGDDRGERGETGEEGSARR